MGSRFWSHDGECVAFHDTEREAEKAAVAALDGALDETWAEWTDQIAYGTVIARVVETSRITVEEAMEQGDEALASRLKANGWDYQADHKLVPLDLGLGPVPVVHAAGVARELLDADLAEEARARRVDGLRSLTEADMPEKAREVARANRALDAERKRVGPDGFRQEYPGWLPSTPELDAVSVATEDLPHELPSITIPERIDGE